MITELEKATLIFRKLAERPDNNDNQVLGQLLYGLALRYVHCGFYLRLDMDGDVKRTCRKQLCILKQQLKMRLQWKAML
jgi:hypothetical protein